MTARTVAWVAFGIYLVVTTGLAIAGMRKTSDMRGFAIGNRDMGPGLVGITLAASVASTATFVINPGFVWRDGISALLFFGLAGGAGVITGLVVLSPGFRRLGDSNGALTLPEWLGARYDSRALRGWFSVLNLVLAVAFVVLIVKGSALVMQHTLGLSYATSVLVVVGFVFSYILIGGTYAHAYTNALQGALMIVVALVLFGSGLPRLVSGELFASLHAADPALLAPVNESSALFGSAFEVFVCGFVVSFGLVCQPHILTKALYLRGPSDLRRYLVVAAAVGVCFSLILFVGLYARVLLGGDVAQDAVVARYVAEAFGPVVGALIAVALLAAGMSTMDGILVSASTIAGHDVALALLRRRIPDDDARARAGLRISRGLLVLMGVVACVIALNPPQLVGLFAQTGVYGLVAASMAPMTFGVLVRDVPRSAVWAASVLGPLAHFAVYFGVSGTLNPATSATAGIALSFAILGAAVAWRRRAGSARDAATAS